MTRPTSASSRDRAAGVGLLVILAGIVLNPLSMGVLLAADGRFDSGRVNSAIVVFQVLCIGFGVWLLLRGRLPRSLRTVLGAAASLAVLVGGYASGVVAYRIAVSEEWIQPRVRTLAELQDWLVAGDVTLSRTLLDQAEAGLERATRAQDDRRIVRMRQAVAEQLLRHGDNARAIELLDAAHEQAVATAQPEDLILGIRRALGIAHLRSGEVEHCIHHHNPERCLFPIRGSGVWTDVAGAQRAIEHFEACLSGDPDDHGARWLLNLAHMAAGSYAEAQGQPFVIPSDVIESSASVARFHDIAGELGLDTFNLLGGAVMDDIDNDGLLDIVTSSYHPADPMRYFHNDGDGGFSDWSDKAGLSGQLGGFNLAQADYDNDGLVDILVLRGGWAGRRSGRQRNSLLRQNPDGTFFDTTDEAGLGDRAYPCQAAVWSDLDNDGDLDLYVGNEEYSCELFSNNGDGTFTEIARRAGVADRGYAKGVDCGDYDNDGDQDIYVSNYGQLNRLYRNNGDGTFTDVAVAAGVTGVTEPGRERTPGTEHALEFFTFTSWFFDFDNDGWLDLFVGGYNSDLDNVTADYLGLAAKGARLRLFRNNGKGAFEDVSEEMGIFDIRRPMGANYGDVNNDGFLDIYLGTGSPQFEFLVPNRLYLNVEGRAFVDATTPAGVGQLQKGHAIAFGDLDNDGDQDIFAQMGGFYPADAFHNALFENPGHGNHWLTVRLVGKRSNRSAIGARIAVVTAGAQGQRTVRAVVNSGASFGASSLQQEIGLGAADRIVSLEVEWPASGTRQQFDAIAMDQFIEITEGDDQVRVLERPSIKLAGESPK